MKNLSKLFMLSIALLLGSCDAPERTIGFATGGIPELIKQDQSGYLVPTYNIIRRNHEVVPDGLLEEKPPFTAIKTIMYRQRHKTLPRLPKTRHELDLQDEWTRTEGGDAWLHRV
jgi:hypothetical protein